MNEASSSAPADSAAIVWRSPVPARGDIAAGPRYWTPFGMMAEFQNDPLRYLTAAFRSFGDVVRFRTGPFTSFLLAHPDHIKHVLQENNRNYVKGIVIAKLKVLIGEGLFSSEGDFWRRQRRLAQPAFHHQRLAGFVATMTDATHGLLDRWDARAANPAPFDVAAEMSALTLEIVGRTLFSRDLSGEAGAVGAALLEALELLNRRALRFFPSPLFWPSPSNIRLRRAVGALDRVVYAIIEQRRREGPGEHADLLGMLIEARDEDTGERMTDRQLRDEVMTFLLAGHETTAVALTWTWYLLAGHPEVEARLGAEIDAGLGGRRPELADLPRLPYARMVVEEAMRLYPPVWSFIRQALADDHVGGYRIPKGAVVNISPWVTHRHPAFWPDPERFDPERFTPERVRERPRFAYVPFSGGPRLCIGNEFALMEAQLVVIMTLQRYRLRRAAADAVLAESRLTLRPRGGLPMTLTRAA